jgi:hypothetical protein
MNLTFTVSDGYSRELVAEIFAAYLLGNQAFGNTRPADSEPRRFGPFRNPTSHTDERWQLDPGNDFFLHFDGDTGTLSNRGSVRQKEICIAMLALFQVQYPLSKFQVAKARALSV